MIPEGIVHLLLDKFAVGDLASIKNLERERNAGLEEAAHTRCQITLSTTNLDKAGHRLVGKHIDNFGQFLLSN
jgi:hypothetical protein